MTTTKLLAICLFFLQLEERADHEGHHKIARWARRRYEWYKSRLEEVKKSDAGIEVIRPRSYRPSRA
jgi:hypothetical protein